MKRGRLTCHVKGCSCPADERTTELARKSPAGPVKSPEPRRPLPKVPPGAPPDFVSELVEALAAAMLADGQGLTLAQRQFAKTFLAERIADGGPWVRG